MSGYNALQITDPAASDNPLMQAPTWADAYSTLDPSGAVSGAVSAGVDKLGQWLAEQRAKSAKMGLWDDARGMPTGAGLVNAAGQYGNALLMGTTAPGAPKPPVQFDWTPGGGTKTAQVGKTELTYGIDRTGDTGEVVLVRTPPEDRGQGEARRAMEQFIDHADTQGTTLFLNADPMDKGVTKGGLDRFYRSLGFVKNMGRNKDFRSRAEYVRQPPDQSGE